MLPNGIDTQANFFTPAGATSPQTVTVDASGFTVGSLAFDNANRYTLNGPGTITLDVSGDHAQINVNNGNHTINAPITLNDDTDVNVPQPTSTLTINSDVNAGTHGLFKSGSGVLEMKNIRAGALQIAGGTLNDDTGMLPEGGGTLRVLANGTTTGASRITSLSMATGATLDLTNNAMAIDYTGVSPATNIRGYLKSGYSSGSWTAPELSPRRRRRSLRIRPITRPPSASPKLRASARRRHGLGRTSTPRRSSCVTPTPATPTSTAPSAAEISRDWHKL